MNRRLLQVIALVGLGLLTIAVYTSYNGSEKRASLAASWSNEEFQFSATGSARQTLLVHPPLYPGHETIACALFIGTTVTDPKLSRELEDAGFTAIQCGDAKVDLP